ncbi:helix-turn-helix domain-containing protein [Embleya sp. NPDC050154]|uniref:helix-turn-helix domain-containing protein n=1 Tax=Embleya sp. NPDC050154 TaxID=3363988 RepID=UPI003795CEFC
MVAWSEYTSGERVKILRGAELTQLALAEAAGVSLSLIQKVEQGGTVTVGSLVKIANALGTDTSVLLGEQAPRRAMRHAERYVVRALSRAVHNSALGLTDVDVDPGSVAELEAVRATMWAAYWEGDYVEFGSLTSQLLPEAKNRFDASTGPERERAAVILADAYQAAACVANVLGARDLAFASLVYAGNAANESGDELMTAVLSATLAWVHMRDSRPGDAVRVCEEAALRIQPTFSEPAPERLAVYGRLMIRGAVAASRCEDPDRAHDYLSQGHAAAARLGQDVNHYQTGFGPTDARIQAVTVALALKENGKALELIKHTRIPRHIPIVARSRYALDVALAQCEAKQWDSATRTLLDIAQEAPDWIRHQALSGAIVQRLGEVSTSKVAKLTRAIGVPLVLR